MEENKSRVYHSLKNARVSLFFTLIAIFIGFFSRKIFLDRLGVEFIGLSGTLQSLLGFLNIAELGIGTAVSYSLYKPLAEDDREKLNDIISVMGYLYSRVGLFVLGAGVVLSFFIPLIFPKTGLPLPLIYFGFYSYLTSSLIGYFLNYRMTLLSADQRNYVVTKNLQMSNITQQVLQMVAAKYCANLYLFFTITLVFSVIYCIILNRKINAYYPWLNSTIANGKSKLKDFPDIKKLIKQVFAHRIGTFAQGQIANVLIYAFVSLKDVALYGNYMTVISKITSLNFVIMFSPGASVGNLIASSSNEKVLQIYKEMFALQFLVSGFCIFMFYHLLDPFVSLWLGKEYIMSSVVLIMVLIDAFCSMFRVTTDQFLNGYGLFRDIWAPYAEVAILLIVAVVFGYYFGVSGIVAGIVASKLTVVGMWKPYFLFTAGMKCGVMKYISIFAKNFIATSIAGVTASLLSHFIPLSAENSYVHWITFASCIGVVYLIIMFPLFLLFVPGSKAVCDRIRYMISRKLFRMKGGT